MTKASKTPRKVKAQPAPVPAANPPQPAPRPTKAAPAAQDPVSAAADAGVARYVPQPPQRDLSGYGGSGSKAAGLAKSNGDLLSPDEVMRGFDPDDVLTDQQAMKVYNDGMNVEQFFKTPMGKKLQKYIDQDIQLFGEMAVSAPAGLDDQGTKNQYRLACAAHYVRDFFMDMLGKAAQAEQVMDQRDENDGTELLEPEG